jgi:hypothetical protein
MPITLSADPVERLTDFRGRIILTLGPSPKKRSPKEKNFDSRNLLCRAVTSTWPDRKVARIWVPPSASNRENMRYQYITPTSSDGSIGRPRTWIAEALQVVDEFEKFLKEGEYAVKGLFIDKSNLRSSLFWPSVPSAQPVIAFLDATIRATCSEQPPTRLLGLLALLCMWVG